MPYTFKQNMVSSAKYSIKCPYAMTPRYVVIHNTANDASAANEIAYMIGNNNQVSYHIAVDNVNAIQAIPFNRNAWAAGDGGRGQGNRYGIHVEICYSKSGGARFDAAVTNAVYVAARLLYQHGLGIESLKKHQDFSGKYCPHRILDQGSWNSFKNRVKEVLAAIKAGRCNKNLNSGTTTFSGPSTSTPSTSTPSTSFKVGTYNAYVKVNTPGDTLSVRTERSASSTKIGSLAHGTVVKVGYIMYVGNKTTGTDLWGGITYNGRTGFICLSYCTPTAAPSTSSPSVTTGTPSKFSVGTLGKKVRIINCDYLNMHTKRDLSSSTVSGSLKAGTIVTVNYIMYEGNKTTGTTLMGSIDHNGTKYISMKYCQLV